MKKSTDSPVFLKGAWYLAFPAKELKKGDTISRKLLGRKLLFGRDGNGRVFCLRDICPHRGIPLSYGEFDGSVIECCYHGWCFNTEGRCTKVPSLCDSDIDTTKIKVPHYSTREINGNIWVYIPVSDKKGVATSNGAFPEVSLEEKYNFRLLASTELKCNIDHAVIGLMDPSHGPYVHTSWWWRSKKHQIKKEKKFSPYNYGFKMVKHQPSQNSNIYKLFNKDVSTEITFQLPGVRVEHIRIGNGDIILLTTLTPVHEELTILNQFIYTNLFLVKFLMPVLKIAGRQFINQDVSIIMKQQEGLREQPALMLLGDADQQARWYFKLKERYQEAVRLKKPFVNPVEETVLKWYS